MTAWVGSSISLSILISGSSPLRSVQKLSPTALPREWKRLALESQTWVQILILSCTNGVILSKSLNTLSLGFLIYKGRDQASFSH